MGSRANGPVVSPGGSSHRSGGAFHLRVGLDPAVHAAALSAIWYLRYEGLADQFAVEQDEYEVFRRSQVLVMSSDTWVLDLSDISDTHRESMRRVIESMQYEVASGRMMNLQLDRQSVRLPSVPLTATVWMMVYEFATGQFPPLSAFDGRVHQVSWVIPHEVVRVVRKNRSLPDPFVLHVFSDTSDPAVRATCPYPVVDVAARGRDPHEVLAMATDKRCLATVCYTDCALNPLLQQYSRAHFQVYQPSSDRYLDHRCRVTLPPSAVNAEIYQRTFSLL